MNATRQDAWTKDEDVMLAETVLGYIRDGKTQLEAFKEVAKKLSRTSAACGFRWNATIRKHYHDAIQIAKQERKQGGNNDIWVTAEPPAFQEKQTIETAILLLEKMKNHFPDENKLIQQEQAIIVNQLEQENTRLKTELKRYDQAWEEMGKLWGWVKTNNKE
jgi:RsfA family transcription factor